MTGRVLSAAEFGLISCHTCGLVSRPAEEEGARHCPRSDAGLHLRKPDSIARCRAFLIAGFILRPPAVIWRILFRSLPVFFLLTLTVLRPGLVEAAGHVDVEIHGITDNLLANVRGLLSIEKYKNDPDLTEFTIRRYHENAAEEIRTALQPFGYYKTEVQSELLQQEENWKATYRITPGEALRIGKVSLEITGPGADQREFRRLKDDFPLKPGAVLEHKAYEAAKEAISEVAFEYGYLRGDFISHEVKVFPEQSTAAITLHYDTGPRFSFGKVIFDQNILDPEFIQGYVPFKEGDPYRVSALLDLQSALSQSQYFSIVEVRPLADQVENLRVPVMVKTEPMDRQKYNLGVGYGTDTRFRGVVGWDYRRINSGGDHFTTELRLSEIKQDIIARYIMPVRNPRTDHVDIYSGYTSEDTHTSESKKVLVGTGLTHTRGSWLETEYLNFQNEHFEVAGESGNSKLILPGVTFLKVNSNDPIYPTSGYKLTLDCKGTTSLIGSNATLIQAKADLKMVRSFWEKGRFIVRTDLGLTDVDEFSNLPASLRFFAGGDNSIRGYSYNSLGPKNSADKVTGGTYLLVGSVEYEHIIYDKWSAAVFYDVGNALKDLSDPIKEGAGLGIRWMSPVGLIKVDFARGLSRPEGGWMLSFNVGPEL